MCVRGMDTNCEKDRRRWSLGQITRIVSIWQPHAPRSDEHEFENGRLEGGGLDQITVRSRDRCLHKQ